MANIIITDVGITPNPVEAGKTYVISVGIADMIYAILESSGSYYLTTADNYAIERIPRQAD